MIIKLLSILILPMLLLSFNDDKYAGLTKSEIKFVKNIERMETESLSKVYKTDEGKIMLEFGSIKYLVNSNAGTVETVWVLGDDDITWENLGPEY